MQFTGKTVEETIASGLKELQLDEKQVDIKIIEEPTKGIFGILKGKAIVEITRKQTDAERALEFVQGIIDIMELDATATLTGTEEETVITLESKDSSSIIGYRGEVLDAIQTLAGAAANINRKDYKKVVVDCENYRDKRTDTLVKLAKRLEEKATSIRREVILEPMSPYERRIIHTALAESTTVTTKSEGKEPNRYVVIIPNDKDEFAKPYNAGRNNSDKGRGKDNRRGGKNFKGGKRDKKPAQTGEIKKKTSSFFGTYLGNSLKN
jgi:spoIIIJ-associated protein